LVERFAEDRRSEEVLDAGREVTGRVGGHAVSRWQQRRTRNAFALHALGGAPPPPPAASQRPDVGG
jgi:hypothetical protein